MIFHRSTRFYATLVSVAIIIGTATFFVLSYNSAHGTVIQLVSASRIKSENSLSETLRYDVETHVWSWGASLQTFVNKPTFSLIVDNYSLPISDYENSTSFQAGSYATYHLRFTTADENAVRIEGSVASSTLQISMIASVTSGIYTEQRTVSNSHNVTW